MKGNKCIPILLGVVLCLCPAARSDMSNGGFETGDLTAWIATGTVAAVTDEYARDFRGLVQPPWDGFWDPTEGIYFASLWSTSGTNASSLSQTFTAGAGLVLQFDYFFDFYDVAPYYDTAVGTLNWSTGSAYLFEYNSNNSGGGIYLADDQNIGWTAVSYILPITGAYTLEFTTTDPAGSFESILGIDNVQIIPTPGAVVLGSIGLSFASWLRRRTKL